MSQAKHIIAPASYVRQLQQPAGCGKPQSDGRSSVAVSRLRPTATRLEKPVIGDDTVSCGRASAQLIGEAGENLTLSRLQSWGIAAQSAMSALPYDLIADIPDLDLVRIQVKTCSKPNRGRCGFRMQRGFYRSKSGTFPYAPDQFDLAAFVCLSMDAVFFHAGPIRRISVRASWLRLPGVDRETLRLAIEAIKLRRLKDNLACLAALPSDTATVNEPSRQASPVPDAAAATDAVWEQPQLDFGFGS